VVRDLLLATGHVLGKSWRGIALGLLLLSMLFVRLWLIRHGDEPDSDASGHLGIARALVSDPTNVAIHWVWLPAYHFLLAGLLLLGLSAEGVRVLNCALAMLVPLVVLGYGDRSAKANRTSRIAPWMAAALCAVSPLVNLLGTSAQQETLFTLLVLGAAWAIEERRFAAAGAILAVAALVRYEAWGAVALLVALRALGAVPSIARWLPERLAAPAGLPLVTAWPSMLAVGGWLLAHKLREGRWLGVLHELYRFTHAQRESAPRSLLWFLVDQPLAFFGSVILILFALGARRAWRTSFVLPLGIYSFLLGAYAFKGAQGGARYYESLTPFVALGAAEGVCSLSRWRWIGPAVFFAAALQLSALSLELYLWTWPPQVEATR
jgi:hypothetical protein